jgi:hypothetical protein
MRTTTSEPPVVAPGRGRDLRRQEVAELHYPAGAVLVVGGVPGAGKTTLLRRLFATTGEETAAPLTAAGVRVLDSEQARNRWRRHLGGLPYRWWRPLVHATHYARVLRALRRDAASTVVQDCATRPWVRHQLLAAARRSGRTVHLLLLDVDPHLAAAGQAARGRRVGSASFAVHCRRWPELAAAAVDPAHPLHRAADSVTLVDRATADRLRAIRFIDALCPDQARETARPH